MRTDQEAIIQQLSRQLEEAGAFMLEMSKRLDVTNVGHCKWQLMRSADAANGVLQHVAKPVDVELRAA